VQREPREEKWVLSTIRSRFLDVKKITAQAID